MTPDDQDRPDADTPLPALDEVRWIQRPRLRRPVLVAAFEGWNDAGDAATTAVGFLADEVEAEPFATIDPETFYDFTTTRPHVRFADDGTRRIEWPENLLSAAHVRDGLDVITLVGTEPQLRWRTFAAQVVGLARFFDARLVVTLGALLAEVPHTRPTTVYGAAYADDVTAELGLMPSRYEGPTGIVGVLHAACHDAGLKSASLWAAVPTYVPSAPSPKAALALVERAARLLELTVVTDDLAEATKEYEDQITELIESDDESRAFVRQLESAYDAHDGLVTEGPTLVAEVERFLRDQGS